MQSNAFVPINPTLDLVLERQIDAPREQVWKALVEPELVKQWFCPKPWNVVDCRVDLRVGGEFYTVMQSPEGDEFPGESCFLDIVPNERLVWSSALEAGFRPKAPATETGKECDAIVITCIITLTEKDGGTHYKAHVLHSTQEQRKTHEEMGFHEGWGMCLTQMAELLKR